MQSESTFRTTHPVITGKLVGGADFQVVELFGAHVHGKLEGIISRQSGSGGTGATTYTLEYIEGVVDDPATALAIVDNDRVTTTASIASTRSDTVADLDSPIDTPRVFRGLKVAISLAGGVNDDYFIHLTSWGKRF